ncbi:hypothetical protein ILYODFUR_009304 [Ilyodon furcidens]|uniref:Uncharacterized protein n=1 Tax=Ilyodon furcidens TaxID=33524 RepID=A0ABV0VCH9_9TELE
MALRKIFYLNRCVSTNLEELQRCTTQKLPLCHAGMPNNRAPVAKRQPAARSSKPLAWLFYGTARCTTVRPCHKMTFGTTHWSFSIWFAADSVVPQ